MSFSLNRDDNLSVMSSCRALHSSTMRCFPGCWNIRQMVLLCKKTPCFSMALILLQQVLKQFHSNLGIIWKWSRECEVIIVLITLLACQLYPCHYCSYFINLSLPISWFVLSHIRISNDDTTVSAVPLGIHRNRFNPYEFF